jgi:hypothetical protein
VKRVNDLDYYSLGHTDLAKHVGLTGNKTTAAIWFCDLQNDPEYFKLVTIGHSKFKRYSPKALQAIETELNKTGIDKIWRSYRTGIRPSAA